MDNVQRVRRPAKLPVVFTPAEARAVLARLKGDYRLMAKLLYGSGLRLMESLRSRVKDIDFGYNRDHGTRWQRIARTSRALAAPNSAAITRSSRPDQGTPSAESRPRRRKSLFTIRAETKISQRRKGLDLAICVPGRKTIA